MVSQVSEHATVEHDPKCDVGLGQKRVKEIFCACVTVADPSIHYMLLDGADNLHLL